MARTNPAEIPLDPLESGWKINLLSRYTLCGIALYFINHFTDSAANLPTGEIFLTGLMVLGLFMQKRMTNRVNTMGIVLGGLFLSLVFVSGLANSLPNAEITRNIIKNTILILPILLYPLLEDKRMILNLIVGIIVGFSIHFTSAVFLDLALDGEVSRKIRMMQPTPVIFLMLLFCLDKFLSKTMKMFFIFSIGISFVVSILIQTRGALLSLAFGGMFYLIGRIAGRRGSIVGFAIIGMLSMHILLWMFFGPVMDLVYKLNLVTVSNLERGFLIDLSLGSIIPDHPWFGVGLTNFVRIFYNTGYREWPQWDMGLLVEGPHNTFLSLAVYYGLPALFVFAAMIFTFSRSAMKYALLSPGLTAMCLCLLVRHGMFYDYAGVYRLEILLMWGIVFFRMAKPASVMAPKPDAAATAA